MERENEKYLMGSIWEDKNAPETDDDEGCTIMQMYLILLYT
jgi:hypothetical protein